MFTTRDGPTTSWQEDEAVVDYHWLRLSPSTELRDTILSVGFYLPETGERLPRDQQEGSARGAGDNSQGNDSWDQPLNTLLE